MTNKQKEQLAAAVMDKVSQLVEFGIDDYYQLNDVSPEEIQEQLRIWMLKLPGKKWNTSFDK